MYGEEKRRRAGARGLKPYEGRCHGCGKVISSKAPNGRPITTPRSVLTKAGYEYKSFPPVLVGNLEPQRRGALHAHLALPYTTPLEMTFTRAFIDSMKRWAAPLCGLGHVQGCLAAEKSAVMDTNGPIGYMTKYLTGKHLQEFLRNCQRPRRHCPALTDAKDRRHNADASQNAAALICTSGPMRDAELVADTGGGTPLLYSRHEHARAP